ncbi:hypothetical protein DMC30DRAFT_115327 [Rhodotorula diobovata]|uniref:Transmembrane proteins 14C-domain-containing protein n=1 Tax=Rhodotorula diobovata TaxID=5288 RepID=A0A5C5G2W2_9BASI|nr:hypothetical protein DMC30DRAFT_115327 [Rhodotorula diobovata]
MTSLDNDTLFGFVSAALISLGGGIGFLKRGSVPSLVAGGGSGALLAYGVQLQRANPRDVQLVVGESHPPGRLPTPRRPPSPSHTPCQGSHPTSGSAELPSMEQYHGLLR